MPQSAAVPTVGLAPCAPPFPELCRGHRALLEIEIVDAYDQEIQVAVKVGNSLALCWASRGDIRAIVGFNPVLGGQDDLHLSAVKLGTIMK